MANTILTPDIIAKEALMVLRNNAVMANLVYKDFSNEYVGAVGDTITIRKPATFEVKDFNGNIIVQDAAEDGIEVTMNKHKDISFAVTSKELTLNIENFSKQFLVPAMQSFIDVIDKDLIKLESDIPYRSGVAGTTPSTVKHITDARKFLTNNAVPLTERRMVIDGEAEANFLNLDTFINAEKVGDNGTALREASLGRKFGLDTYVDQNIEKTGAEGSQYTSNILFHKNAFALVTRPLALPLGNKQSSIVEYDGLGLRVVQAYDINAKKDVISIDILYGVKTIEPKLASIMLG